VERRNELVHVIQQLAREEAGRQPSAADWLAEQDRASGQPAPPAAAAAAAQEPEHGGSTQASPMTEGKSGPST